MNWKFKEPKDRTPSPFLHAHLSENNGGEFYFTVTPQELEWLVIAQNLW